MIYLYEHHIGFDADTIGFPSISGCHAIVLQANAGLYGYHSLGGVDATKARLRAAAFAQFVRTHTIGGAAVTLYGACFVTGRGYSGDARQGWKDEIKEYATALGVATADIRGFDIGTKVKEKLVKGTTVTQSAYVEFRLEKGACGIFYKRQRKMRDSNTAALTPDPRDYSQIHPTKGSLIAPNKAMKPVEIITTRSNKGELHAADAGSIFGAT